MKKDQRVRDFIHDLIVFRVKDENDRIAWNLINTREFQRLRRIKQLGFSEFVFPGATHTRFSHCIGVYHTARLLLERVRKIVGSKNERRERVCLLAALLHDIGHGPFSHAFEDAQKKLKIGEKHEYWSGRIIEEDTEIRQVLESIGDSDLPGEIANLLTATEPADIYASIVSSQLDADRLDYLRRDRYMTGTGLGGFDFEWLLDCLDVENIQQGEDRDFTKADTLCLNHKGLRAAEGFLLARFHLFSQVYLHKTTRSAEKMLTALLQVVYERLREKDRKACPIPPKHPLVKFLLKDGKDHQTYFQLNDFSIWEALRWLSTSNHEYIRDISFRLLERRLYKCFDAGALAGQSPGDRLLSLRARLLDFNGSARNLELNKTILRDEAIISAYSGYDFQDRESLQKVLIRANEGARPIDIFDLSSIVKGMQKESLERYYVPDDWALKELKNLWEEVSK